MASALAPVAQRLFVLSLTVIVPMAVFGTLAGEAFKSVNRWIYRKIDGLGARASKVEIQEDLALDAPPCCPKCRQPMMKRMARTGPKKDSGFWGLLCVSCVPWDEADGLQLLENLSLLAHKCCLG
jgi:hypothetical protein